jgi:hypothetical protein
MKLKILKTFGSLFLSALLGYSSVAWAFDECLSEGETKPNEQVSRRTFYDLGPLAPSARAGDESGNSIHCIPTYRSFDAIAPASSIAALKQSFKDLPSTLLLSGTLAEGAVVNAWTGRSPPNWVGDSLSSGQRPRYLLLAVFLV